MKYNFHQTEPFIVKDEKELIRLRNALWQKAHRTNIKVHLKTEKLSEGYKVEMSKVA